VLGAEDEDTMSVDEDEEKQEEPEYLINIDTQCLKLQSESIIGTWRKDKAWVRPIQTFLKEFGYLHGSIDGDFGTQTKSALIDFQRDSGLVADGIFGIGTAKYIQDHCGEIGVSEDVEEENEEQSDLGDEDNTQSDTVIFKNIKDFFFNSVDSVSNWIKNLFIKNKKINPVLIDTENNEIISVKETIVEEKIVISFAEGTNKSVVSQYSLDVLRDVLIDSDNSYALITSTSRTPEQQAQAMIDNVISKGISSQYRLYGKNGDLVLNLYPDKQAMIDKIYELGPSTVSKHCADFNIKNIIDIAPFSIEKRNKFLSSSKNEVRISKVLSPEEQDGENAYHLEILQN